MSRLFSTINCFFWAYFLSLFLTTAAHSQRRILNNQLTDYNPYQMFAEQTKDLKGEDFLLQKIYSRGNDEGWKTEASYETALMFVHLKLVYLDDQFLGVGLNVYANISTAEASHAAGVLPYAVRLGSLNNSNGYMALTPAYKKDDFGNTVESFKKFHFSNRDFENRIVSRQFSGLDARGQWISTEQAAAKLDMQKDGVFRGAAFIQSKKANNFNSNFEYDSSVKHKILWVVEIQNGHITKASLSMLQPKVKASNPNWLSRFLVDSATYSFTKQQWRKISHSGQRFPEKQYSTQPRNPRRR